MAASSISVRAGAPRLRRGLLLALGLSALLHPGGLAGGSPETPPAAARKGKTMTLAPAEVRQLAQAALDVPPLQKYFHVDQLPERKPLVVALNKVLEADPGLTKFGSPVVFVPAAEVGKRPHVEFTRLERDDSGAVVELRYAVEGIRCKVRFEKDGETWKVASTEMAER